MEIKEAIKMVGDAQHRTNKIRVFGDGIITALEDKARRYADLKEKRDEIYRMTLKQIDDEVYKAESDLYSSISDYKGLAYVFDPLSKSYSTFTDLNGYIGSISEGFTIDGKGNCFKFDCELWFDKPSLLQVIDEDIYMEAREKLKGTITPFDFIDDNVTYFFGDNNRWVTDEELDIVKMLETVYDKHRVILPMVKHGYTTTEQIEELLKRAEGKMAEFGIR